MKIYRLRLRKGDDKRDQKEMTNNYETRELKRCRKGICLTQDVQNWFIQERRRRNVIN